MNLRTLILGMVILVGGLGALAWTVLRPPPKPVDPLVQAGDVPKRAPAPELRPSGMQPPEPEMDDKPDPNGFKRPCSDVLEKPLDEFTKVYKTEMEDQGDATSAQALHYYLRCVKKHNASALSELPPAAQKHVTQLRGGMDLVNRSMLSLMRVTPSTNPVMIDRGQMAREDLTDAVIDALRPGKPQLPPEMAAHVQKQGEVILKTLRSRAEELAKENGGAPAEMVGMQQALSNLETEFKELPPTAVTLVSDYLRPYLPSTPRPEPHPAGWVPPPPPPAEAQKSP